MQQDEVHGLCRVVLVAADSSSDCCLRLLGGGSQSCHQFQAVAAPSRYCTRSCSTGLLRVGRRWLRAAGGMVVCRVCILEGDLKRNHWIKPGNASVGTGSHRDIMTLGTKMHWVQPSSLRPWRSTDTADAGIARKSGRKTAKPKRLIEATEATETATHVWGVH